jgi:inositol polyphosphate 1-phosphatase
MKIRDLVREIVNVSEKAARLARTVRAEHSLFQLLVQQKTGEEKNKRFVEDFKTLADVLVQETVSHDLGIKVNHC